MYNQTYEEYMRNVLGYAPTYQDMEYTYRNDGGMNYTMPTPYMSTTAGSPEVEEMYPDIYRIVYPMVQKACGNCQGEITGENVERITMEIYTNVEGSMETETQNTMQNRKIENRMTKTEETKGKSESRNRNFLLQDLIRILVLRELLGRPRPPIHGPRPPMPGNRPPFPGGPMQPRNYQENGIFY